MATSQASLEILDISRLVQLTDSMLGTQPQQQVNHIKAIFGTAPIVSPPTVGVPNFVNYSSKRSTIIATSITCLLVTILFVAVRVFVKLRVNKLGFRLEDWFCMIGTASFVAFIGIAFGELQFGAGQNQFSVTIQNAQNFTKLAIALEVTYCWAICFAKLSLVVTYLNIFANQRFTRVWYSCWIIILSNTGLYIASFLVAVLSCIPFDKLWNPFLAGSCIDSSALFLATSALNMVFDIAILVLPLVCVWQLQTSTKRKRGVSIILATGLFCVICSLLRFINAIKYAANKDLTYFLIDQALWSEGEITSALIASCMLSIPQFFQVVFPRLAKRFGFTGATVGPSRHTNLHSLPQQWSGHPDGPPSSGLMKKNDIMHQISFTVENPKDSMSENDATSPSEREWA